VKRYIVPVLVFALLLVSSSALNVAVAQSVDLADNYSFATGLELSRVLDRQFIFSFMSSGCSHCQTFKEEILSAPDVKEIIGRHFILSLVTVDESFKIKLPEQGEATNLQLASQLGVEGTPTTFIFYPPNPELLKDDRVIGGFAGPAPNPEAMADFLEKVVKEELEETKGDESSQGSSDYYNYRPSVKTLTKEDFGLLKESEVSIPIVSEKVELSDLPESPEIILDIADNSVEDYAGSIVTETEVKKVFLVKD